MRTCGLTGELRIGYHVAARLGGWTMESIPTLPVHRYRVTAEVHAIDAYWITRPVALILYLGKWSWIWQTSEIRDRVPNSVIVQVIDRPFTIKEIPCPHLSSLTLTPG